MWYKLKHDQIFKKLNSNPNGLSSKQAAVALQIYGRNELKIKTKSIFSLILEPFLDIFVLVLLAAAALSIISREYIDAGVVIGIILINALIFYIQSYSTSRVLSKLREQYASRSTVVRNGHHIVIDSRLIVPGDIISLSEGVKISADARIIEVNNLSVNEASLTGESKPVRKVDSVIENDRPIYEQDNMVFQNSFVISGSALVIVVATGNKTEFGKIAGTVSKDQTKSPVQQKIKQLLKYAILGSLAVSALVFLLTLARGMSLAESLNFAMSMLVSAVPEGLPVALTVVLVFGMRRMGKKNALVKDFKSIEDVGLITVIATDKTGTITKNKLAVVDSWNSGDEDVLAIAAKTVDMTQLNDPLDKAIIESAVHSSARDFEYVPFDTKLRMSAGIDSKSNKIYIKGAPEHILNLSDCAIEIKHKADSMIHQYAAEGHRVIAVATADKSGHISDFGSYIKSHKLKMIGLMAFADQIRPESKPAIAKAIDAGISVKMITGDHHDTAFSIGKQIGLATHSDQVVDGSELPTNNSELIKKIANATVFARVLPDVKYKILRIMQKKEIVAMTGDGVNDVPALAAAHVGFAMGSGSDIAKDASGVVLLRDNFENIVETISEGRKIYNNIRKMVFYLLSTSVGEILAVTLSLVFNLAMPATALQILWTNLITDTLMVIPIGFEKADDGIMQKPPRKPNERLLDKNLLARMGLVSGSMAMSILLVSFLLKKSNHDSNEIQAITFTMLVVSQWANSFNARSETELAYKGFLSNRYLLLGLFAGVMLQLIVLFGPLRSILEVHQFDVSLMLLAATFTSLAVLAVSDLHKIYVQKKS